MPRYKLKTHEVEAAQFNGDSEKEIKKLLPVGSKTYVYDSYMDIDLPGGRTIRLLQSNWFVVREIKGEYSYTVYGDKMFREDYEV